jgi:hypothetical protein
MNPVHEFARRLAADLSKFNTGPSSPYLVEIEETAESARLNPLQNGFANEAAFERARQVLVEFHKPARRGGSYGRDEGPRLTASDEAMLQEVLNAPPTPRPSVLPRTGKQPDSLRQQYAGNPNEPAAAWISRMEGTLANRQKDSSAWHWWNALRAQAAKAGTVGALNPEFLEMSLAELSKNLNGGGK